MKRKNVGWSNKKSAGLQWFWFCQGKCHRKLGWRNSKRPMRRQISNLTSSFFHGWCLSAYPKDKNCDHLSFAIASGIIKHGKLWIEFSHWAENSWENQRTTRVIVQPCDWLQLNSHEYPQLFWVSSIKTTIKSHLIPLNCYLEPIVGMVYYSDLVLIFPAN